MGLGGKSHGYRPMKLHFITFKASESTGLFGKPRTQSIFRDGLGKFFSGKFRLGFYFCLRVSLIRVGPKSQISSLIFGKQCTQSILKDGSGKFFRGKFRTSFLFLFTCQFDTGKIYMGGLNRNRQKEFWDQISRPKF